MASVPAWLRIIRNIAFRPTLPFIVGAIRDPIGAAPASRDAGQQELFELLRVMDEEAPADCGISIEYCPSIDEHVATCVAKPGLTWRASGYKVDRRNALGAKLWECYGDEIARGLYSKKNGKWYPFTEDELTTIRTVLDEDA